MIVATRGGDRELRAGQIGDSSIPPWYGPSGGALAHSGERVTLEAAAGIPAVALAIRRISMGIASFYLGVFEGRAAERRERLDTWQGRLLDMPALDMPRFNWKADMVAPVESCGNALAYKSKSRGQVVALTPIDSDYCTIYRDRATGEKLFKLRTRDGVETLSTSEVLHLRGFTLKGGLVGHSPIALHRHALGATLARDRFEGRYFRNDAKPGLVIVFPAGVTAAQARDFKLLWDSEHQGEPGKTGVLGGGADIKTYPLSMEDAQFVESKRLTVEEVARIFDVPLSLLHVPAQVAQTLEQDALRFLSWSLRPRMILFEDALKADPDLFGVTPLYPEFVTDSMLYVDAKTRAEVEHRQVQSGLRLRDEVRGDHGWGPLPPMPDDPLAEPGRIPVLAPVGANPAPVDHTT